jgi:hypothetical protein
MQRGQQREDGLIRRQQTTESEMDGLNGSKKSRGGRRRRGPCGLHPPLLLLPVVATALAASLLFLLVHLLRRNHEAMENRGGGPAAMAAVPPLIGSRPGSSRGGDGPPRDPHTTSQRASRAFLVEKNHQVFSSRHQPPKHLTR